MKNKGMERRQSEGSVRGEKLKMEQEKKRDFH